MNPTKYERSGYCDCACPTCFDTAIADGEDIVGTVLCAECRAAGCEAGVGECVRTDDDMDEDERDEREEGEL